MYTLRRRAKTSLIVPLLFLIVMTIIMIYQDSAATQAVNQGVATTATPFDPVFFAIFLAKLVLIYIISIFFLSVETLTRIFITDKDSPSSIAAARDLSSVPVKQKIKIINTLELTEGTNKITHSVLFQIMMVALCLFAATSSNSILGRGITLAIVLQIIIDQAILLKAKQDLSSWFWQIKAAFPLQLHQAYFAAASILSLICIYAAIR
ncbi:MAG: hypothetical protein M3Q44_01395 [bacterium]|nr:hypothetical protein [bacterium]